MMAPLLPPQASSIADNIDALSYALLALSTVVVVGVFAAMTFFCIKYRRGSKADRSGRNRKHRWIEVSWTVIPLALFLGLFAWSLVLYERIRTTPADAAPIYVIAKQWMWQVAHPGGQRELNTLHVPLGRPVRLVMTSDDVIHSFYVPAFRLKQDVLPGRYTDLWFTATQAGTFDLFCTEYCGVEHSRMGGQVVVLPPAQYAQWLEAHAATGLAARGATLFRRFGCSGCHGSADTELAPGLAGLYGSPVPLANGEVVVADERYLHDSILLPDTHVAAGYAPIMPSFRGQVEESEVLALVAYLKSVEPRTIEEQP